MLIRERGAYEQQHDRRKEDEFDIIFISIHVVPIADVVIKVDAFTRGQDHHEDPNDTGTDDSPLPLHQQDSSDQSESKRQQDAGIKVTTG